MGGFTLLTQVTAQPIALFKKNLGKVKRTSVILIFLLIGANVSDEIWESVRSGGCCDEYWRDPCRARGPGSTTLLFLAFLCSFDQNWSTFWNSSYDHRPRNIDQDWNLQQHFVMVLSLKSDRSSVVEEAQRFKTIVPGFSVRSVAFNQVWNGTNPFQFSPPVLITKSAVSVW